MSEPNVDKVLTYLLKVKRSGQCKAGNEDVKKSRDEYSTDREPEK